MMEKSRLRRSVNETLFIWWYAKFSADVVAVWIYWLYLPMEWLRPIRDILEK